MSNDDGSSLAKLISPLSPAEFLTQHWGRDRLLQVGVTPRCPELFSWNALSQLLSTHRFDYPRLRLLRRGEVLEQNLYVTIESDRRGNQHAVHTASRVEALLQSGAMLHLTSVAEAWAPLSAFCAQLERELSAAVQVNVHAGYGGAPGFHTHWDGHDVFALQLDGAKRWKLFGNTELAPLAVPPDQKRGAPTQVVWEGTLRRGDMLYLPRGYWHATEYVGEPSLHLTFAAQPPTGLDFLSWLRKRLAKDEIMRRDMPAAVFPIEPVGPELKAAYMSALRKAVADGLSDDLFDDFLAAYRGGLGKTNAVTLKPQ